MFAPIAQLDRASVCGTEGHRFDFCWAHHFFFLPYIKNFLFSSEITLFIYHDNVIIYLNLLVGVSMESFNFDVISLIIGLVVGWVLFLIKSLFTGMKHKKELEDYRGHIERQMKITQEGTKNMTEENDKLKKENENLRISVKTLGQKPGRNELRLLNVYDAAIKKMMIKAPGFAQGWGMAVDEAEREYEENESGLRSVIKRAFSPGITHKRDDDDIITPD